MSQMKLIIFGICFFLGIICTSVRSKKIKLQNKLFNVRKEKQLPSREYTLRKTKGTKKKKNSRETNQCIKTILQKMKKFQSYDSQLRKSKRIITLSAKLDVKNKKAKKAFEDPAKMIRDVTKNGTQCREKSLNKRDKSFLVFEHLQKCSSSAVKICNSKDIKSDDFKLVESCKKSLSDYISAFKVS